MVQHCVGPAGGVHVHFCALEPVQLKLHGANEIRVPHVPLVVVVRGPVIVVHSVRRRHTDVRLEVDTAR
jgi:hypothetical protein